MKKVLFYSDDISSAQYSVTHPFKPVRAKLLMELLHRYLLIHEKDQEVVAPVALDDDVLLLFHDRAYLDLLKAGEHGEFSAEMLYAGLGTGDNPLFRGMYDLSRTIAGGTFYGARMVAAGEADVVFNPIGGMHHAGRDHASGFCYINDIAITAIDLINKGLRVAYVDIDAHHGNGVQDAFYGDDRVLTISLHESGKTLYPGGGFETETGEGRGRGYAVNVPLREGTDDAVFVYAFESVVPPLLEAFRPDIVLAQLGADSHRADPLAHLNITSNGYQPVVRRIREMSPRIVAMGGGGYNVYRASAMWAITWAALCGLTPVDQFLGSVGGMMYGPEAEGGRLDDDPFNLPEREKEACWEQADRAIAYIREHVFPIHGL